MKLAVIALLLSAIVVRAEEKLQVASLSTVLTDIAKNVGGDRVDITTLVKPGVDPHAFEPSPGDIRAISRARIVLASGLGFEGYLDKLRKAAGSGPVFLVAGDSMKPIMVDEDDHGHSHGTAGSGKIPDPHWWHSIANLKIATRAIRDAFIATDPADKATFEANTSAYLARLDELANWTKIQIAQLPREKRILVTSHDALGYFARDYGFEVHPVEGISTTDQPSSKKVRELIAEIKKEGVKAIFAENIENPKVLTEITRETGAKPGGTLYSDGLGDSEANTYEAMIRHNVTTIVNGLK